MIVKSAPNAVLVANQGDLLDALKSIEPAVRNIKDSDKIDCQVRLNEFTMEAYGDLFSIAKQIESEGEANLRFKVSYAQLLRSVKALIIDAPVRLIVEEEKLLRLESGRRTIELDVRVVEDQADEFSIENKLATFSSTEMSRALNIASRCARQTGIASEPLGCVALEISDDQFDFVGTDNHRLVARRLRAEIADYEGRPDKVLIPAPSVKAMIGLIDASISRDVVVEIVDVGEEYSFLRCILGPITFTSSLVDGDFPNWRSINLDDLDGKLEFFRRETLDFLAAVQTFTYHTTVKKAYEKKAPLLNFSIDEETEMLKGSYKESASGEISDLFERAKLEVDSADTFSLNVQPAFLFDLFDAIRGDTVELALKLPNGPLAYRGEEITYVMMPALRGR